MAPRNDNNTWVRLLDGDFVPEQPQLRLYPGNLAESFDCLRDVLHPHPDKFISEARAIGSHWCISDAGVTPGYMIETASPDGDQSAPRLNQVLYEVVPACLTAQALRFFTAQYVPPFNSSVPPDLHEIYLFHVQAGMRIYELYSALDGFRDGAQRYDSDFPHSLASLMRHARGNDNYAGPWALETMGGAGGQTIGGVISTATHGGDLAYSAISDSVVAMHLIGGDGKQHWIERTRLRPTTLPLKLVDEAKLHALYDDPRHGDIEFHRDDDLMNAAVVACGRMGVIYSVVLRVVRQYALEEHCEISEWQKVKSWITNPTNPVFDPSKNRYAQIDINPYGPFFDPIRRRCYVITRTLNELDKAGKPNPLGRVERAGDNAGKQSNLGQGDGDFSNPCASDNWIRKALQNVRHEFVKVRDDAIEAWLIAQGVILSPLILLPSVIEAAIAAQTAATATITLMEGVILSIEGIIALLPGTIHFGDTLAWLANLCADLGLFLIFGSIYESTADSLHEFDPDHPRTPAISYAAMDVHDYQNVGCVAPGDTIEFFFDADSANLPNFIDHVLLRVQELASGSLSGSPAAFGGYISLRFMTSAEATLAMQRWPRTCSIEIAGLRNVHGTEPLLKALEEGAKNFGAILHWGQRNGWGMKEIENRYDPHAPFGPLFKWRNALSVLSDHGRYAAFSTQFTKLKGLEITTPIIQGFAAVPTEGCFDDKTTVTWEARSNPPETQAFLVRTMADGSTSRVPLGALSGSVEVEFGTGQSTLRLLLERTLNGRMYVDKQDILIRGISANDPWKFVLEASPRVIDGTLRWVVEINLFSQFITNALHVQAVHCTFPGIASWHLRNSEIGDVHFTTALNSHTMTSHPIFNRNWLFFSDSSAVVGPAPVLSVDFMLVCEHS